MKIRVETDTSLKEDEVIIRCRKIDENIIALQKSIIDKNQSGQSLQVSQGDTDYYLQLEQILFMETDANNVVVHTKNAIYETRMRLYELLEILPSPFLRVSKSTIINTGLVKSLHKNITGASQVEFFNSDKKTFVSRSYYRDFAEKMEEKRLK